MATHVTYEEAMANLKTMFSSIDQSIIEQMLQQNRGHLERTVEQLLMMGDPSINQSINQLGVPDDYSRRRSSAGDAPRVGGSNLPDDFMRPPSYFGSGTSQIDQDALLAQMLQDEMFMAELRANPELYFDEQPPNQSISQSTNQGYAQSNSQAQAYQPPGASINQSSPNYPLHQPVSGRGDFSGYGTSGSQSTNQSTNQSFKDKWNGLTAAAKKRLLTVAGRMKPTNQSTNQPKYRVNSDLNDGLLDSDADFPEESTNQSTNQSSHQSIKQSINAPINRSTNQSSDTINERDIELEEGVYTNDGPAEDDDQSIDQSTNQSNRGYVPPAAKRWGQKLEDQE